MHQFHIIIIKHNNNNNKYSHLQKEMEKKLLRNSICIQYGKENNYTFVMGKFHLELIYINQYVHF
jgi:hypothetical protein